MILNNLSDTKLGYIKTEGVYTEIHIPKDNIKIMKKVLKYKDTLPIVELNEEVLKRTYGLTNVYGAVKIDDISKLDSFFKQTDTEELETLFKRLFALNMSYKMILYNDKFAICSPEIRNMDEVNKILETEMDYKIYDRDVFDKFCNETYVETLKPYKELIKELKSINYSSENIKYIKDYVINDYLAMHHFNEEGAKNFFWKSVQSFSNDRVFNNLLYEKVIKIADRWPKWLLKGDIKNSETIKVVKVGRNEPCPCGSGKKYKKCCGRS